MRTMRVAAAVLSAAVLSLAFFQTALAAQPVWKYGAGGMTPTYGMDLDTGIFKGPCCGNDLFLEAVTSSKRFINSEASTMALMASRPGYAKCASAALGTGHYRTSLYVGRWFCVKTSEGRYARFKITSDINGGYLVIKYKTWCKLGDPC